jgi:thiol:disulfide interchange protein
MKGSMNNILLQSFVSDFAGGIRINILPIILLIVGLVIFSIIRSNAKARHKQ